MVFVFDIHTKCIEKLFVWQWLQVFIWIQVYLTWPLNRHVYTCFNFSLVHWSSFNRLLFLFDKYIKLFNIPDIDYKIDILKENNVFFIQSTGQSVNLLVRYELKTTSNILINSLRSSFKKKIEWQLTIIAQWLAFE